VDRAAHAWITGHPSAAPALPDYINGIADGVLGGAVFGAPAGFKGERSVSDAMRAATSKISGDLDARAAKAAQRPAPGEPVNPDGSKVAGSAQTQFDKNLSALKDGPDDHFDGLMNSVKPYNVTDDGVSATLNGPAAGLVDPSRNAARAGAYETLFDNPTQKTIASMLDDNQWTSAAVPGVKVAAKAFENGYSRLASAEKNTLADFVNNTLAPDQAAKFKRVLATVDAMSPDTRARVDFQKSGKDLAEAPGTPKQFAGADAEPSLAAIPDDQWNAATFRQTKNGPARNSPAEENVRLVRTSKGGDDYSSDLNMTRAASALASTDTGKETLAGGGNRKVNAVMGVYAEAQLRGQHIPSSEIRPGLRVFPGEDGRLSATEAATIRKSFDRATAKAKLERANPVAMADAQTEALAPGRGDATGAPRARVTTDRAALPQDTKPQTATGDLQGLTEKTANPLGAPDLKLGGDRQIENTARRSAEKLGIPTKDRTPGQLYEDALHMKDSANGRALKSAVRQLSETDPEVARHMEQADHRKAVSDFAGERVTGDNGALIPWLKAAADGKKPTRAQLDAFKAIQERTDNFAGMSDKAKTYARSLIDQLPKKETAATKVIPNTLEENASNLSNAELKSRLSNKAIDPEYKKVLEAERDARGTSAKQSVGRGVGKDGKPPAPRNAADAAARVEAYARGDRPNLEEAQVLHQWLDKKIDETSAAGHMASADRLLELSKKLNSRYEAHIREAMKGFSPELDAALRATVKTRLGDLVDLYESHSMAGDAAGAFTVDGSNGSAYITLYSALSHMYETNPTKTALHEVGHAAVSLFDQSLGRKATAKLMKLADTPEINRQLRETSRSENQFDYFMASPEERFVEAYSQWATGNLKLSDSSPAKGLFEKLKAWFGQIRGDMTLKQAFEKIESGDLAKGPKIDIARANDRMRDSRFISYNSEGGAKQSVGAKETVGSINKEIADADKYARSPPKDFTAEQAAKLEARMREVSTKAAARRDALGEEHEHYQTFDDIRMNAKDAANALKEVIANDKAARDLHPDWFDKKVPLAEQSDPKGDIRTSIEAIQKTPEWKSIGDQLRELKNAVVDIKTKVREKAVLKTMSKAFGVSEPKLEYHTGSHPAFITADGRISLNTSLKGAARTSSLLHEFGHHLINEKFSSASVETKKALIADYKTWRRAQGNDALDTRLSRAPLFSGLRLLDELGNDSAANKNQLSAKDARYLLSAHEYFADSIARALEQHEGAQGIVGRFMGKVAQVTKLAYDLARGADSRLTDSPASVREWVHSLYEAPAEPDAVRAPPASASGEAPIPNHTSPDSLSAALSPADRGALFKVFGRRDVMQQLLTGADKETAEALGNFGTQMPTAINEGFRRWAAGDLVLDDHSVLGPLNNLREAIKKVFGIATNKELAERILADAKEGKLDQTANTRKTVESETQARLAAKGMDQAVQVRKAVFAATEFSRLKMKPVAARFISSLDERMRATNVPALHALAAIVHRQTGERGTGQDMMNAIQQNRAQYWDRYSKIVAAIPEADRQSVVKAAQAQAVHADPALEAHRQNLISFFKQMEAYQRDKGVVMGSIKDYIPVVLDPAKVRADSIGFQAMLSEPKLEQGMRDYFKSKGWDTSNMSQLDMINKMHDMASYSYDYTRGGKSYADTGAQAGGKETRTRVSEFIYRANDPVLNEQFAKYQTDDIEQLGIPYVSHAVRRAEFTSALGKTPDMKVSTLDQLLARAKEQGATPAHIEMAKDFVNAAIGSYAPGLNPFFAKTIGAFDRVFNTKLGDMNSQQYRNLSNAIIAYQNLRVLGLGLFGNLIDPLGVWTRSSSVSQTWKGYKGAFKATMSKDPTFLRNMAESLGAVEAHATTEALSSNYGSAEGDNIKGWSQRVNRALFKVNGMEMITNFARLAATETGNKFLLAHADDANAHSARYLKELGLTKDDIKEDPQHPGYVQRNAKVDQALYQFVNESVLRPVATQKPLWHSDPHFAVASQYKGYLYAFYATITERMLHEVHNGNATGVAPIAGYLGVSMAAELAREMVQFGPGGNPNRKDWDADDYMKLAANRAGLAGPKLDTGFGSLEDIARGGVPLNAVAGPSVSQAQQLGNTIFGHGSAKNAAIEALPGQSLFHGWVEGKR
jgi:hypothetical protein